MIPRLAGYYLSLNYWNTRPIEEIRRMQVRKFREIFEHARKNSKFYNDLYREHGVLDLKIGKMEDISRVPVIDKKMLRRYSTRDIMTCDIGKGINIHSTSGSTGEPFKVAFSKAEDYTAHVRVYWALRHAGYRMTDKIIMIARYNSGDRFDVEKDVSSITKIQRRLRLFNREIISCYEPVDGMIEKLKRSGAKVLWSTPATVQVIADRLRERQEKLSFPVVFLTGEPITRHQKEHFQNYIGGFIVSLYGAMESPSLGFDYGLNDRFTVFPNSNLFQFINTTENEHGHRSGTVVISNLLNKTMPILRYNLNDFVSMDDDPSFGTKYLNRIIGRQDDILDLPDGRKLTELHTYEMMMDFHECETFKFVQTHEGAIILKLIPAPGIAPETVEKLGMERWRKRFETTPITIEIVEKFEADPGIGKFKTMEKMENSG